MTVKKPRVGAFAAIAVAAALALTGCTAPGSGNGNSKVTLTYWGWAPNMKQIVGKWNASHPDIQVKYTEAAGAGDLPPKLLSAERAGNGPDLAQAEYQKLPSLVVGGVVRDITKNVASFRGEFTDATWGLTSLNGAVYGVPQDVGPLMMFYRTDLFAKYGITAPKTWDEFAADAQKVHAADPSVYLGTLPQDAATFTGYVQQAGGNWWTADGEKWKVGINDPASVAVGAYWQKLAEAKVLYDKPYLTPEWNKLVSDDKMLTWSAGVWAPGVIENAAATTAGKWAAAPLPQWKAGDAKVGFMGGSAVIVTKSSQHAEQATKFLEWLNGGAEGSGLLASVANIYPASIAGQKSLTSAKVPSLVSGQADFYTVAAKVSSDTAKVTWGPNVQLAFDAFSDDLQSALSSGKTYADALDKVQDSTVADLKKNGFTVEK